MKNECEYVRALDAQRVHNKGIFGSGYLLCEKKAKIYTEAVEKARKKPDIAFEVWPLSPRELKIIERLDAESSKNDNCT